MTKALILIGFKACGKTSVGTLLAQKMGVEFVDTDRLLVAKYGAVQNNPLDPADKPRDVGINNPSLSATSRGLSAGSSALSNPMDCREIYRIIGEQAFRSLEKTVLIGLQQTATASTRVIATGGGIVLDQENRALLQKMGQVIYLSASFATLLSRLKARPLPAFLSGDLETELQTLYTQRDPVYRDMADLIWDTKQDSVSEVTEQLSCRLGLAPTTYL